ncbi:MMPL family transporter [Paenibacillaceae bacterium]|nr:MMPL family transporter [Paenibacillaceae bacterium]
MQTSGNGLGKFGAAIAGKKTRWITLGIWIVAVVALNLLFPQANSQTVENAPNLPDTKMSVQAEQMALKEFPNGAGVPALIVLHRQNGLGEEDISSLLAITQYFTDNPLPYQTFIPPFHQLPPQALTASFSEDKSTAVLPVFFENDATTAQLKDSITQFQKQATELVGSNPFDRELTAAGELTARVTGPVGIAIDATGLFENADFTLLVATVLLVLILLLLIYRSPILAIIPLIGVGFAYGVISPLLGWFAQEGWLTFDSQGLSIMTVLLFGAGTDYCLFLIARFRQVLKEVADRFAALRSAVSSASGAVAMSGFTVVISLLALLLAEYGSYARFALPFSLSIFIMMIASLTLVPALLAIIGRASFFPFIPRTPEMLTERALKKGKPAPVIKEEKGFSYKVGSLVSRRPWTVTIVSVLFLGILASFATQVQINFNILSSFPANMPSREGFTLIGEQFSEGELAPVKLMIDTEGKETDLAEALAGLPFVAKVGQPAAGAVNADIVAYDVEFTMDPYSNEAMEHLSELRTVAESSLQQSGIAGAQDKVWISGKTAEQYDTKLTTKADTMRIIPVVIGLISLLLFLYLRSISAMLYLMGTVLLSFFSALGLGWLVIHHILGADFITGSIPLYAFVFLVALGEDYNIFMVSSIWQKKKHMPLKDAIRDGVAQTGSVITSAGLILAGTFAVLASLPIQVLVHFGIITSIGIILDTFIVRPFTVPAITALLGRRAFWPSKYEEVRERSKS